MHRKMEGRRISEHPSSSPLIHPSVREFIWLQLTEYGWFSTDEDNTEVAGDITDLLFSMSLRGSYREVFHTLFDSAARTDFTREISIRFLSLDPAPNDPSLRSFVGSLFTFYHDLLWQQKAPPKLLKIDPDQLVSDECSVDSDAQESMLIVCFMVATRQQRL